MHTPQDRDTAREGWPSVGHSVGAYQEDTAGACGSGPGSIRTRILLVGEASMDNSMAKTLGLCKLCLDLGFDSACDGTPLHG